MQIVEQNNQQQNTCCVMCCDFDDHYTTGCFISCVDDQELDDFYNIPTFQYFLTQIKEHCDLYNVGFKLYYEYKNANNPFGAFNEENYQEYPQEKISELFLNTIGVQI